MARANVASLIFFGYLVSTTMLFPQSIVAETTELSSAPSAGVIPELAEPKVECTIDAPKNFVGKQSGQSTDQLLTIRFGNCNAKVLPDGTTTLSVDVLVELSQSGNVQFCNNFAVAMLFEVASGTENFAWPAERTLVSDLDVENIYGDRRSLGLFGLHSKPPTGVVQLSTLFGSLGDGVPRYDNMFWGRAIILQENSQGEFARTLRERLPISATGETKADHTIKLSARAFAPRGLCTFKGTDANSPGDEAALIFSAAEK
ncbi:hypothetical protein [uncultured Aliiroseovarius sp.]|uniref:hypothetical protein n=1 Tax=uncultured Aliiroseovarius sp. TaxID=1658783 RepID=UPI002634B666|nr:hypothetical protein [uncultured Aliiroseovarius sp.]